MSHSTTSHKPVQVYLIRAGDTDHYKIGISNRTRVRLGSLQIGSPLPLSLVATCTVPKRSMAQAIEAELHSTYADVQISGEWYSLDAVRVEAVLTVFRTTELIVKTALSEAMAQVNRQVYEMKQKIARADEWERETETCWREFWDHAAIAVPPSREPSYSPTEKVQVLGNWVWSLVYAHNQFLVDCGAIKQCEFDEWHRKDYEPVTQQRHARLNAFHRGRKPHA